LINDVGLSCARLPRTPRSSVSLSSATSPSLTESPIVDGNQSRRWARRKSAKSLVNFTANILELSEEEKRTHRIGGTKTGLTPRNSISSDLAKELIDRQNEEEKLLDVHSSDEEEHLEIKSNLVNNLKNEIGDISLEDRTISYENIDDSAYDSDGKDPMTK